jgi:hypothetical protein
MTLGSHPTRKEEASVAQLRFKQRERVVVAVWQLWFVGCLARVRTDTSACNSSMYTNVETGHPRVCIVYLLLCVMAICHYVLNSS